MANVKLLYLINYLLSERSDMENVKIPNDEAEQFRLYRSLVNIRPAVQTDEEFLRAEDVFLTSLTESKGITDIADLQPVENGIYLWKGDITTLKCGAIVNAANSGMTGCWQPCHSCIDNCIHTFAGVRLRYKCTQLMKAQGHEEPIGNAKITPSYNLPCDYIIRLYRVHLLTGIANSSKAATTPALNLLYRMKSKALHSAVFQQVCLDFRRMRQQRSQLIQSEHSAEAITLR